MKRKDGKGDDAKMTNTKECECSESQNTYESKDESEDVRKQ